MTSAYQITVLITINLTLIWILTQSSVLIKQKSELSNDQEPVSQVSHHYETVKAQNENIEGMCVVL